MSLQGCRVLVVEDNHLLADQVVALIEKAGATVCGPFPTRKKALPGAVGEKLDGAVLDVKLGDGDPLPIAQALRRGYVPFVVVSGYGSARIPRGMCRAPFLAKPILGPQLVDIAARFFRLPHKTSAPESTKELLDLAYRVRGELASLTGKSGVMVRADVLPTRLRAPSLIVDRAVRLAESKG